MNPVVKQILDNIGRLGRELENRQPNPPQMDGGKNKQFLAKVKCCEFSGEAQASPLPVFIPVMLDLLALLAMSSLLVLPQLPSKDQVTAQIQR